MGVTGAGKTTVGSLLARELGWSFADADNFHSVANIEKMRAGEPLSEADREPWLRALESHVAELLDEGRCGVLACSALRSEYRERLRRPAATGKGEVRFVYLEISLEEAQRRLRSRKGHFMPASLVESQFDALEVPHQQVLVLDGTHTPDQLVAEIREAWTI
ncbi:MAG: gluconokinase [Gemmatimonadetes bacterium]|nr:gluconokinase [Gemmatimonadota bacterium]